MNEPTIPRYAPLVNMVLVFTVKTVGDNRKLGNYVSIASADNINFDVNNDFTIEIWVKLPTSQFDNTAAFNAIVEKSGSATGAAPYFIRCNRSTGQIVVGRYDGANNGNNKPTITSATALNDNLFHYVAFQKSGGNLFLYIDGKLDPDTQRTNPVADTTTGSTRNAAPLLLGKSLAPETAGYLSGSLGQLRIWARALTSAEIKTTYEQSAFLGAQDSRALTTQQRLVGDWRCNEGYSTIAYDYAANNNGRLGGDEGQDYRPQWFISTIRTLPIFLEDQHVALSMTKLTERLASQSR